MDSADRARVFSVLFGGDDHAPQDEAAAARLEAAYPEATRTLKWCRNFSADAVRQAVAAGIEGVLVTGSGFPAPAPPHQAAGPGTWVAYVDGPKAVTAARVMEIAMNDGPGRTVAVNACATEPRDVLVEIARLKLPRGTGRLQVQLGLAPALFAEPGAAEVVARWAPWLPSGSQLTILVPLDGYAGLPELFGRHVPRHTAGDPEKWLADAGLESLMPVTDVRNWGITPARAGGYPVGDDTRIVAAAGYVPR